MATDQTQSSASEETVRQSVAAALTAQGATIETNQPGTLVCEVGSVGKAYLAGGFRAAHKMPMRITLATVGGPGGTGISVNVEGRGTAGGIMSGGVLGVFKQKKGVRHWMNVVLNAIPQRAGAPAANIPPPPA